MNIGMNTERPVFGGSERMTDKERLQEIICGGSQGCSEYCWLEVNQYCGKVNMIAERLLKEGVTFKKEKEKKRWLKWRKSVRF